MPEEQPRHNTPYPGVEILADKPSPPQLISPRTIPTILEAFKNDLNVEALTRIIQSLLRTIEIQAEATDQLQEKHHQHVTDLQEQILHYEANHDMPPNSFLLNTQLTYLIIPVKDGPPHLIKWIHMLDGHKATCHVLTNGLINDPTILNVYVAPTSTMAELL